LDPVDGTTGFIRGGQYAISLALLEAGSVTLGVMGCPNLSAGFNRRFDDPDPTGQIFFARKQAGAWCLPADQPQTAPTALRVGSGTQGQPVRVVESVEAAHSNQKATAEILAAFASISVERLDSQCKYGVVARNQADVYFRYPSRPNYREKIWDHAAGAIIATEAGGIVSDIDGKSLDFSLGSELTDNRGIICATRSVHPAVVAAAREFQARGNP
jgi:3'(2'), 5'-bisphosphate nucleotidase